MMGPDIFSNPFVGGFTLLIFMVIFMMFFARFMPYLFSTKASVLRIINLVKLIVIFTPLFFAMGALVNYVEFDLIGWISLEIILLPTLYFLELLYVSKGWLK